MLFVTTILEHDGPFISLEEWTEEIDDPDDVRGAIILILKEKVILDESLCDNLTYVWPCLIDGLPDISDGADFETDFPDLRLTFSITHANKSWLLLHVFDEEYEFAKVRIKKSEYLSEMVRAGGEFLTWLETMAPGSQPSLGHYQALLKDVSARLQASNNSAQ